MSVPIKGSIIKMAINFSYPTVPTLTLDDVPFSIDYYCQPGKIQHFDKNDLIRTTEGSAVMYFAPVDSVIVGTGKLKALMTVDIPDADFPFGYRREMVKCESQCIIEANPIKQ